MQKAEHKRLVLLDAHAILHRAYHALPDFTSAQGEPTGALYGLSAMLLKLIADLKPDYLAACFDLPGPTYRHEAYEAYKGKRPKLDDVLASQISRSRDIFKAFSIPIYEKAGFEADDALGTIVETLKKRKDIDIIIASGDMDTLQLVDDKKVRVYTLKKGINDTILYDEDGVVARFGFSPAQMTDYKGLRGDPSDNIIGVPGIGEKTATDLINAFGTIEDIYAMLKKKGGDEVFTKAGFRERVIELLRTHEEQARFSKMLATIKCDVPIAFSLPEKEWRENVSVPDILELFTELSFRTLGERVKVVFRGTTASLLPDEPAAPAREEVPPRELAEASVALWLIDSTITDPDLSDILQFAKTDSFSAARTTIEREIEKRGLAQVYREIELPLIPIVERMHRRGVRVDLPYLKSLSKEYTKELGKLEKKIFSLAGEEFNINSSRQLAAILFDKLGLSVKNHKKTGTGLKSTRESELEKMRDMHPLIAEILSYRELQKLLSTYIDNLPAMVGEDGRLHARFLSAGTTTGRMSSQNPNLQNIPIRSDLGNNIRKAFIAANGFTLVALDYSQIELRVAAFLSKDEKLSDIFRKGGDVHSSVASEVFRVPPEKIDYEMRRRAKIINFGILYGMGINSLRASLGSTRAEAQAFYDAYFETFSGLAAYLDRVKADAARKGYTETYFGRRRYFEGIKSSIPFIRASAERMAINAPIQGTESDIIKIAMARVDDYLREEKLAEDAHLLLQVHDELVYEIKKEKVKEIAPKIKEIMETVLPKKETGGIVFTAEIKTGENWGEMRKLGISH